MKNDCMSCGKSLGKYQSGVAQTCKGCGHIHPARLQIDAAPKTIKNCAGSYARTDGVRTVQITYFEHLRGWIAAANWDHWLHTDQVETKSYAVECADMMLAEAARGAK